MTFFETLLVSCTEISLCREEDATFSASAIYRGVLYSGHGERRSNAIGAALEPAGFTDCTRRLLGDADGWMKVGALLDGAALDKFSFVVSFENPRQRECRVVFVRGSERIVAVGNTPLEAIEVALADPSLKVPAVVPEAFTAQSETPLVPLIGPTELTVAEAPTEAHPEPRGAPALVFPTPAVA